MASVKIIEYPFTTDKLKELKVGDMVKISGRIYTGRDRLHKHLFDGGRCPVNMRNGLLYHCGPVVLRKNEKWEVLAAGPTTSIRQEPYTPSIIERQHVKVIMGKGGMGDATRKACAQHGCVYLQAVGGAAALLASRIEKVDGVHFLKEFGQAEALWELTVQGFEAVVAIDSNGKSIHAGVKRASKRALKEVLEDRTRKKNGRRKNGRKKNGNRSKTSRVVKRITTKKK
jgi:tartrate/fumarate subfamily iron-sulfur-dependent hydro-lyase beta chain